MKGPSKREPQTTENYSQWAESSISRIRTAIPMFKNLYDPPAPATTSTNKELTSIDERLPTTFSSPPLMPGFVTCLTEMLGEGAVPTPIQALSIKWLLAQNADILSSATQWRHFLLASDTGSGKSIAYLLPVLQHLKQSERRGQKAAMRSMSGLDLNPRALIIAPTHELARQLSRFAKKLLHEVKLSVMCASRGDIFSRDVARVKKGFDIIHEDIEAKGANSLADVVVGTPMTLLEKARGRGWQRLKVEEGNNAGEDAWQRGPGKPKMCLANVDVDLPTDPDFQEHTRMLLAAISSARGSPVQYSSDSSLSRNAIAKNDNPKSIGSTGTQPLNYPFNLILTTATIPSALASYLDRHHPNLVRLASPTLHHLPKTLATEYVAWTGGNKFADIERRIRQVWADDSVASMRNLSKILIFCNKNTKVTELGEYLTGQGIKNMALTSASKDRKYGSNKHLEGFLRPLSREERQEHQHRGTQTSVRDEPHVMITTSLLSRGLDFSPDVRHVFIVDEPRNMIDFLHRAGRSGRAGQKGKVVVFGKMKGRGSAQAKETRKRIGALAA
ncbi:hypothetical protein APHAL10511_005388 [Amanita phalloides]|nr:hypothetical protein APHAL10511_005388 [Amanita phalloides]